MIQCRFNVFETNSSSQHSLSVIDEQKFFNPLKPLDESILFFSYGGVEAYNEDFGKRRRGLLEDDPLRKKVQDEFFKILTEFHSNPKKLEGYRPELKKVNSLKEMAEFF